MSPIFFFCFCVPNTFWTYIGPYWVLVSCPNFIPSVLWTIWLVPIDVECPRLRNATLKAYRLRPYLVISYCQLVFDNFSNQACNILFRVAFRLLCCSC